MHIQKLVIAKILRSKKSLVKISSVAKSEDFNHKVLRSIYDTSLIYFERNKKLIGKAELNLWNKKLLDKRSKPEGVDTKKEIKSYKARRSLIKGLYEIETFKSVPACYDEFVVYKKEKEFGDALFGAVDIHERTGDVQQSIDYLTNVLNRDYITQDFVYSDYLEGWEDRQLKRLERKKKPEDFPCIPTGFNYLDRQIRGIVPGELFTVLTTTGRGKSIFLIQQAYIALLNKFDVCYISLENSIEQTEQRLDSRITKILYDSLGSVDYSRREMRRANEWFEILRKEIRRKIHIYFIPPMKCTVGKVIRIWNDAKRRGLDPKKSLLLLDYLDLVSPDIKIHEKRLQDAYVYRAYKSWLTEEKIPSWTATQARREFKNKKAYDDAMAEAYEKARICDGIISLNQDERQKIGNRGTLIPAKMRDHASDFEIPIVFDTKMMTIKEDMSLWDKKYKVFKKESEPPPPIDDAD